MRTAGSPSCVTEIALPATRMPSRPRGKNETVGDLDLQIRWNQSRLKPLRLRLTLDVMIAVVDVDDVGPAAEAKLIGQCHRDVAPDVAALASRDVDPVVVHRLAAATSSQDRTGIVFDVGDVDRAGEVVARDPR